MPERTIPLVDSDIASLNFLVRILREGLTKPEAEEIIGCKKTATPYPGKNFALAKDFNQPIIAKNPTDTVAIIQNTANDVLNLTGKLRKR